MALPEGETEASQPRAFAALVASREGLIVGVCLLAMSALAWWWLVGHDAGTAVPPAASRAMPGMDMAGMDMPAPAHPLSIAYFSGAFAMWAIMMVAMMLPTAAPMIALHEAFSRKNQQSSTATAVFAGSYLLVWTYFAAMAALLQAALVAQGGVDAARLTLGDQQFAAGILLAAGVYELSPLKHLCLSNCQSPVAFLVRNWRPGAMGALRMGLRHGAFCVGCCAVLMLLLFVGGVMNLAWIALLTAVILAEKYAPPRWRADRILAACLMIAALVVWFR